MKLSILLNNNSCVQVDQLDNSANSWNSRRNKNNSILAIVVNQVVTKIYTVKLCNSIDKNIVIKSLLEIKLLIPNTENKTINGCSARILKVRGGSPASDETPGNPIDCTSTFEEPARVEAAARSSLFN